MMSNVQLNHISKNNNPSLSSNINTRAKTFIDF